MDLNRAEKLFNELSDIVDYPLFEETPRAKLSVTLAASSMQFAAAVRILCAEGLLLGASATLRSQFESLVRCVWAFHRATESQVEKLTADLNSETQQASKNIPLAHDMMIELEKFPKLANLLVSLKEFKESSWPALNSFVHSGIHAVHWTKNEAPPQLVDQVFRISNALSLLAYQNVGILTGRPEIQSKIIAVTACYSSCLPIRRDSI